MNLRILQGVGAALVGVMILAIGFVLGSIREADRADDSPTPGPVDIGFAQDMSEHHDQAILMARTLPADVDPEIRGLADRIITTQTAETATMRGWLTWFGLPPTGQEPMSWMAADHAAGHAEPSADAHARHTDAATDTGSPDHAVMPGMASTADLQALASLRGVEAEVLFLRLMTRHHQGGVQMATAAHNSSAAQPATKQLAMSMIDEQGTEIGLMRMLLLARGSEPFDG